MDDATELLTWTHGGALIVRLLLDLVLLGVAATVVRRARGDAAWLIASASLVSMVNLCLSPALTALLARSTPVEEMPRQIAVVTGIGTVVGGLSFALLIAGIARLAAAARPGQDPREAPAGSGQ